MNFTQIVRQLAFLICFSALLAAQAPPLTVADEPLPTVEVGVEFHHFLHASGGVPPYVWSVASGDLPDGISLSPEGLLSGRPTQPGAFNVMLEVEDSGHPAHTLNKPLHAVVTASLLLEWLHYPKVQDNRIDGSVIVSNSTSDTFDLTVIVVAVADNGRATAIGYEHFPLKGGTTNFEIPFGNTLPRGPYVIHADAIAEIPKRRAIFRQRLQTPQALQVMVGP
ncbi:MAG: putative Ig domain-containing protein [Terriglobales bacterium]